MAAVDTFLEYVCHLAMCRANTLTRYRQLRSEQITIRVATGDDSKDYRLPKALLCSRSTWFNNALKDGRFQEARTGIINLPDDSIRAFDHFVRFLYVENLVFDDKGDIAGRAYQLWECCQVWALADKVISSPQQMMGIQLTPSLYSTYFRTSRAVPCQKQPFSSWKQNHPHLSRSHSVGTRFPTTLRLDC